MYCKTPMSLYYRHKHKLHCIYVSICAITLILIRVRASIRACILSIVCTIIIGSIMAFVCIIGINQYRAARPCEPVFALFGLYWRSF